MIAKLVRAADGDLERAQNGIVYLDEIDKLAKRPGHDRDVSGEGVQQGLLKLLEGKKVQVRMGADKNGVGGDSIEVDTSNIMFIGGGAFDGLATAIEQRGKSGSGFVQGGRAAVVAELANDQATNDDLMKFGFLPEFLGRFPVRVCLKALDEQAMVRILTEPRDALLRQYQRLFQMENAHLECTPEGLSAIARRAMERGTGARGLRAVLEDLLLDAMFDLPSKRGGHWLLDETAVTCRTLRRQNERLAG